MTLLVALPLQSIALSDQIRFGPPPRISDGWSERQSGVPSLSVDNASFQGMCSRCGMLYLRGSCEETLWTKYK